MKKIAILGIKGFPSKGGAERALEAIITRLKESYNISVYCSKHYTPKDTQISGIKLIRTHCAKGKHLHVFSHVLLSAVHALLIEKYDLIHIHNAETCFVVPLLRLRYPVLATSHGPAYERKKWGVFARKLIHYMDFFFIKFPNRLTSVSLPMAETYKAIWGIQAQYIPNGVDERLPIDDIQATHLLNDNGIQGPYFLFSADRIDSTKGCHTALDAFMSTDNHLYQFVVVGNLTTDKKYGVKLKESANDDNRVHFISFIKDKGILFGLLTQASIFVFPSEIEAMSMALLEASSLAKPIICSDIPANKAVLNDKHAVFFRTGDTSDLKDKMQWAIDHPEEMKQMGVRAQEWVRQHFSWDAISKQYQDVYESMTQ